MPLGERLCWYKRVCQDGDEWQRLLWWETRPASLVAPPLTQPCTAASTSSVFLPRLESSSGLQRTCRVGVWPASRLANIEVSLILGQVIALPPPPPPPIIVHIPDRGASSPFSCPCPCWSTTMSSLSALISLSLLCVVWVVSVNARVLWKEWTGRSLSADSRRRHQSAAMEATSRKLFCLPRACPHFTPHTHSIVTSHMHAQAFQAHVVVVKHVRPRRKKQAPLVLSYTRHKHDIDLQAAGRASTRTNRGKQVQKRVLSSIW